jgi:hypothetical protein
MVSSCVRFDSFIFYLTLNIDIGWWEHKEMHKWLLPGVIQCLSDMDPDVWHIMEATTNFGEAQHAANNKETGIGMGLVESFIQYNSSLIFICRSLTACRYEALDTRRAAEIEIMLQSGNLHNPRNEVSHRYASRNARRVTASEKAKNARAEDDEVQAAEQAVADAQAHLKQIRAEKNVRFSLTSFSALILCSLIHPGAFLPPEPGRVSLPKPVR